MNHTEDSVRGESACANCHKKKDCLKCHESDEVHIPNARSPEPPGGPQPGHDTIKLLARWLREAEPRCTR